MTGRRGDLAGALMALATRYAPAERRDWAKAMQAEFAALDKGRLSWAVGCLVAAARWRAAGEASYTAALAAGVVFVGGLAPLAYFGVAASGLASRAEMARIVMPLIAAAPVLAGFVIALNWPGRRLTTAVVVGIGPSLIGNAMLAATGAGLRALGPQVLIGWAALVVLGYLGALAGSALGRRRARRIAR